MNQNVTAVRNAISSRVSRPSEHGQAGREGDHDLRLVLLPRLPGRNAGAQDDDDPRRACHTRPVAFEP